MKTSKIISFYIRHLEKEEKTSMGIWCNYWIVRAMLRKLALERYEVVTKDYYIKNLDFPSEGFKIISNDTNSNMDDLI